MSYDPRNINQMYEQYSKTHSSTSNANKTFADSMKAGGGGTNLSGSGSSAMEGLMRSQREQTQKDNDSNTDEDTGGIKGFFSRVFSLFDNSGAKKSTPIDYEGSSVYNRKEFNIKPTPVSVSELDDAPQGYDPLGINTRDFGKGVDTFNTDTDPEIPETAMIDIGNPNKEDVNRGTSSRIAKAAAVSAGLMTPALPDTADAINRTLSSLRMDSKEVPYLVQSGDTLSDIAARTGTTVKDLVKANGIKDKNKIYTGEELIIPTDKTKKSKEEVVNNLIENYELRISTRGDEDPQRQFNQSGVPMDQRIFEPELGEGMDNVVGYDDVPQMVTGLMSKTNIVNEDFDTSDVESSRTSYESVKKVQKRLNDLGYTTLMGDLEVDGQLGGGTARQLRKFQATAGLPVTAAAGQPVDEATMKALKNNKFNNKEGKDPSAKLTTLSEGLFQQIKKPIAQIESGGESEPYAAIGGDADDYDGKYQFGWRAKEDLRNNPAITDEERAKLFHVEDELNENDPSRVAFRADTNLQEKAFRLYVNQNHDTLTKNSAKYRAMDDKNKLAVLGYAHNQGAENALEWLTTTVSGTDAFGTRGDRYSDAVVEELSERKKGK